MVREAPPPSQASIVLSGQGVARGMRRLAPISVFVAPYGIAFGVAATEVGLSAPQAVAMSALVFTALAQFATLEFLQEPVAHLSLAFVVLALSARHIVIGAALAPWINRLPLGQRLAVLATLTDANFADASAELQKGGRDLGPLFGGGLLLWLVWTASTALGAYGGDLLGDPDALGFGVVMVCFFAATVTEKLQAARILVAPVAIAVVVAIVTLPVLPQGWNIIVAAVVGGGVSTGLRHE